MVESLAILLNNVEQLAKERNFSKQKFCDEVGISRFSFVNWAKQSSLPSADVVIKIANYCKVDPSWLIGNSIVDSSDDYESTPEKVFSRIFNLLLKETGIPDPDYHEVTDEQYETLFAPVAGIVSKYDLLNWEHNRIQPNIKQIEALARHFNCTFEFIAHGIKEDLPLGEEKVVSKENYDFAKKYSKYKYMLMSYDNLYEPDRKMISELIARLFRLKRHIGGYDFDTEWNAAHPTEPPRQKDPDLK
ncbi:helix-turn-helix transcriptional regulator [Treponema sp.]|uniref:helix-turn-helix domain-containing protein n=1 Tax=Treponema sp. TaxID=166 RepID=UPI00298DFA6C|nr:helix-turn-helix transcriptional regulator [Treponema sp.]MCQ2242488.1 helix-turn-helix domain-containing protein [Treponema sp.]